MNHSLIDSLFDAENFAAFSAIPSRRSVLRSELNRLPRMAGILRNFGLDSYPASKVFSHTVSRFYFSVLCHIRNRSIAVSIHGIAKYASRGPIDV